MAGIHRERPGAEAIAAADGSPAVDLGGGIWMSPGLSNSYLLATDDGRVVVNSGMGFEGPLHRRAFDDVDRSETQAIILTQGHYDHVGGVDALRHGGTDVIAQAGFATWRGDNERLEAFRARNAGFAWAAKVRAAVAHAASLGVRGAPQARPEPTITVADRQELVIGGRRLELLAVPGGETTDSLAVWLPDERTVLTGNVTGPLFGHVPNLVTVRGDRYRDALEHIASLERVRALGAERLVTGHFDPIDGADRIAEELTAMCDAMQWVHDRTVDGMNAGSDVHTLMAEVRVPSHLDVGEGYGRTSWNVRAIWEAYSGWFHHRSTTELFHVPPSAVAADLVAVAGVEALVGRARTHVDAGRPLEAIHLADIALAVAPGDPRARAVAVDAHRRLREESTNWWESAWLDHVIDRLELPR